MKCVQLGDHEIVRVSDDHAAYLVNKHGYRYVPKSTFKAQNKRVTKIRRR